MLPRVCHYAVKGERVARGGCEAVLAVAWMLSVGMHFRQFAWLAGRTKAGRRKLLETEFRWLGMSFSKERHL